MARLLRLQLPRFLERYTKQYSRRPGWRMLRVQPGTGDCVFLENGTKCGVYGARPLQCSSYPWWPELQEPGG